MYGEDKYIYNFYKNKLQGFYVDVGAYHPLEGNNTYLLYKKNKWSGINIDINLFSIELFKIARSKDVNLNIGISNSKKLQAVYFRKNINMLNTLNKKIAKTHFHNGFFKKYIKTDKLSDIIKKTKYKNKKIDFLNIDVEGVELNVLKSLNFKKYDPKLICIEIHNHEEMYNHNTDYLLRNPIYKFLLAKKYKVVWSYQFSYIFRKNK